MIGVSLVMDSGTFNHLIMCPDEKEVSSFQRCFCTYHVVGTKDGVQIKKGGILNSFKVHSGDDVWLFYSAATINTDYGWDMSLPTTGVCSNTV